MGRVSESYDEGALCPRAMPPSWWFSLPSQTRTRIKAETELPVSSQVVFIGEVQDALIAKGLSRLMGTYMRAMQACLDKQREEDDGRAEKLRLALEDISSSVYPPDAEDARAAIAADDVTYGVAAQPHFGFHEPRT